MTQLKLDIPNPEDWLDVRRAAALIGCAKPTVYDLFKRGVLAPYYIGSFTVLWRADVQRVADARIVLGGRR